jgi:hypothetical protein
MLNLVVTTANTATDAVLRSRSCRRAVTCAARAQVAEDRFTVLKDQRLRDLRNYERESCVQHVTYDQVPPPPPPPLPRRHQPAHVVPRADDARGTGRVVLPDASGGVAE